MIHQFDSVCCVVYVGFYGSYNFFLDLSILRQENMLAKWMSNGISIQIDPRRTPYYLIVFAGIIGSSAIPVNIVENNLDPFNLTILMPNVTTTKVSLKTI